MEEKVSQEKTFCSSFCAWGSVKAYIFLHVVGHLGQVILAIANFFLHIHHNQSGIRVVLQNRVVLKFCFRKGQKCVFSCSLCTHLDIFHQVLVEVFVALVNGIGNGPVPGGGFITTMVLSVSAKEVTNKYLRFQTCGINRLLCFFVCELQLNKAERT